MLLIKFPRHSPVPEAIDTDGWIVKTQDLIAFRNTENADVIQSRIRNAGFHTAEYTAPSGTMLIDVQLPEVIPENSGGRRMHYTDLSPSEAQGVGLLLRHEGRHVCWISYYRKGGVWVQWESNKWDRAPQNPTLEEIMGILLHECRHPIWLFASASEAYVVMTEDPHGRSLSPAVEQLLATQLGILNGRNRSTISTV